MFKNCIFTKKNNNHKNTERVNAEKQNTGTHTHT